MAGQGLPDLSHVVGLEGERLERGDQDRPGEVDDGGRDVDLAIQGDAGVLPRHAVHLEQTPPLILLGRRHDARERRSRPEDRDPAAGDETEPLHVGGRQPDHSGVHVVEECLTGAQGQARLGGRGVRHR